MASLQAAAGMTGSVAMHSSSTPSSSFAHLQLGIPLSSRASLLSSLQKFVQFTECSSRQWLVEQEITEEMPGSLRSYSPRTCYDVGFQKVHSSVRQSVHTSENVKPPTGSVVLRSYGATVVKGTGREILEDTVSIAVDPKGIEPSFFGVFDGHGGLAVAELLKTGFWPVYKGKLSGADPEKATASAYEEFDKLTLAQPKGLFGGLRERGVGGSRCGATAATVVFLPSEGGKQLLVASNVGDSRVVLCRGGTAIQLTFDHTPDVEGERKRIEAKNPTPKKPLVVNVDGTWRLGGLLALSRAFGDVYLKDWSDGQRDGARGGFGLTAEPHVTVQTLVPEDEFVILGTDGLWEFISNEEAVNLVRSGGSDKPLENTIGSLIKLAQERGTTDDITVVIVRPS